MESHIARRILFGLMLVALGGLFLAGQLGFISINASELVSTYWPVSLIFIGLSGLIGRANNYHRGSQLWSLFMLVLGVGFLLRNLHVLTMDMGDFIKLLIPTMIILFGIRMMMRPSHKDNRGEQHQDYSYKYEYKYQYDPASDQPTHATTNVEFSERPFGSVPPPPSQPSQPQYDSSLKSSENKSGFIGDLYLGHDYWELRPMNVSHFIGDTIIDLTKAQIPFGETRLNVSAFIGDVKVFVPNDIDVEFHVSSSSFLGDITVFNRREGGFLRTLQEQSPGYLHADKKIKLQCSLFIGDIHVQRVG